MEVRPAKKQNILLSFARAYLQSYAFPFVTAAFMVMCYYLSLDMLAMYYIVIFGLAILLLLDDITPFLTIILFLNVFISYDNSPAPFAGWSDYYFRPANLSQIVVFVVLLLSGAAYRLIRSIIMHEFKPTPAFFGLCGLSAAFLLNGIFVKPYTPLNLLYGLIQAGVYLGIFAVFKDNIRITARTYRLVAVNFMALSALLCVELVVQYLTADYLFIDGSLYRNAIVFGWGVYNALGMLLLFCVPSALYLASELKHGWLLTAYSLLLAIACFASLSRQAMLGIFVIYPLSLGFFLFGKKGKRLVPHIMVLGVAALLGLMLLFMKHTAIFGILRQIFANLVVDGELNGSGRMELYLAAVRDFNAAPIFGKGFFGSDLSDYTVNQSGLNFVPIFYHNTLFQLLGACGGVGFIAYVIHRAQTVYSLFGNFNKHRYFLGVTILTVLVVSLVDIHMFNILPTLIYSTMVAFLIKSEKA